MTPTVNPLQPESMYAMGANALGAPGLVASWRRPLQPRAHQALLIISSAASTDDGVHEPAASVTISGAKALHELKAAVDDALGIAQAPQVLEPTGPTEPLISVSASTLKRVRAALAAISVDKWPDGDGVLWMGASSPDGSRGAVNLGSHAGIVARAFHGVGCELEAAIQQLDAETGGLK